MAFVLAIPVTNWLMHMYTQGCTNTHTYTTAQHKEYKHAHSHICKHTVSNTLRTLEDFSDACVTFNTKVVYYLNEN